MKVKPYTRRGFRSETGVFPGSGQGIIVGLMKKNWVNHQRGCGGLGEALVEVVVHEEVGGGRDGEQLQRRVRARGHVRAGLVQVVEQVAQVAQLLLLRTQTITFSNLMSCRRSCRSGFDYLAGMSHACAKFSAYEHVCAAKATQRGTTA